MKANDRHVVMIGHRLIRRVALKMAWFVSIANVLFYHSSTKSVLMAEWNHMLQWLSV